MSAQFVEVQTPPESKANSNELPPETISGLVVSLLFWMSLFVAVGLFAAVALSSKLLERARLTAQYQTNQSKLVAIERQNEQLQRVVDAIRNDKDFAAEMTRVEFDAARPGEEIIPVEPALRLVPQNFSPARPAEPEAEVWYRPYMARLAEDDTVRKTALGIAASLILISFTWLLPATRTKRESPVVVRRSIVEMIRSRYVRST